MSSTSLDAIPDPDETGTDTFVRYRYQAAVAFPLCLRCARVGDIVSVTPERIEDLLVEEASRWRFIQIKTRDAGYGAWKFSDLLSDGGAARSFVRTHEALGDFNDGREIVYEAHLEGAAKRGDNIENLLVPHGTGATDEMVSACVRRLEITDDVARAVLSRTRVNDQLPPRGLIHDRNVRDLQRFAPNVLPAVTEAVYDRAMDLIESAMRGELLADSWPECVMQPETSPEDVKTKVAAKRLVAEQLDPLFAPLGAGNLALLALITDAEQLAASELDRKLVAAGASESLRANAKQLRANASRAVFEASASAVLDIPSRLTDVDLRLLVEADAIAESTTDEEPADAVWRGVLDEFANKRQTLDPNQTLGQDPMLLAGRLCELSDLCKFAWGA